MVKNFMVGKKPHGEITQIPHDAVELLNLHKYGLVDLSGLDRPDADVSRSALAGMDASRMYGSHVKERNIVMTLRPWINPDVFRQELYDILPFNTDLRFYIATENRHVFIDGRIEKLGGSDFSRKVSDIQISILCPFPWFQSIELHKTKLVVGENTIRYNGDVSAGWELHVPAQANPPLIGSVGDLSVEIGGETFAYSGNVSIPYICTIPRKRAFYGYRAASSGSTTGTFAPAFGSMVKDSAWPLITRDAKAVTVSCSSSTQDFFERQNIFAYRDTFSGV